MVLSMRNYRSLQYFRFVPITMNILLWVYWHEWYYTGWDEKRAGICLENIPQPPDMQFIRVSTNMWICLKLYFTMLLLSNTLSIKAKGESICSQSETQMEWLIIILHLIHNQFPWRQGGSVHQFRGDGSGGNSSRHGAQKWNICTRIMVCSEKYCNILKVNWGDSQ